MSVVTDVTVILGCGEHEDRARLVALFREHEGIDAAPVDTQGSKVPGVETYAFGLNYAKIELLDALIEGPWEDGTVVFIDSESDASPRIKVFGEFSSESPPSVW